MTMTVLNGYPMYQVRGSVTAHLVDQWGGIYGMHNTPEQGSMTGFSPNFTKIQRQGLKPLIRFDTANLRVLTFTHTITVQDSTGGQILNLLRDYAGIAENPQKYRLINLSEDFETRGWWYVTDLTITIKQRDVNQQPQVADLAWTFTEANDDRPTIAHTPPPPPPPTPNPIAPMQADYTVVHGDSLWSIASRFLGNGARWTEIYDLNQGRLGLTPPEMYKGLLTVWIYPGQVMQIPAK